MRRIVALITAIATTALVVATPGIAATPRYTVSGIETGIPQPAGGDQSTSPFAGAAFSWTAGFATWTAHVTHHSLAACATLGNGCITGGDFAISGRNATTGTFVSGSIALVSGSSDTCTSTTVYDVTGVVDLGGGGTATFTARLTHHQARVLGECVPYFATVRGSFG